MQLSQYLFSYLNMALVTYDREAIDEKQPMYFTPNSDISDTFSSKSAKSFERHSNMW